MHIERYKKSHVVLFENVSTPLIHIDERRNRKLLVGNSKYSLLCALVIVADSVIMYVWHGILLVT